MSNREEIKKTILIAGTVIALLLLLPYFGFNRIDKPGAATKVKDISNRSQKQVTISKGTESSQATEDIDKLLE